MNESPLYQAIMARRSVRRYATQPLPEAVLEQVRALADAVQPLVSANRFSMLLRSDLVQHNLVALLGAYGHLITPPHAMVPYLQGTVHPLTDLGYRVEQIVVRMTALGIATCYIGTLPQEERARQLLALPSDARIGALVVFGYAAETIGGRAFDGLVRSVLGRTGALLLFGACRQSVPATCVLAPIDRGSGARALGVQCSAVALSLA